MPRVVPADEERWAAVGRAVKRRMGKLGLSTAELARRVRSSETTIRDIVRGIGRHNESMLVGVSAVLDWPTDYLVGILSGEADENAPPDHATVGALRQDIARLRGALHNMDQKIDVLIADRSTRRGSF